MRNKKLLWILGIVFLVIGSVIVEGAIGDTFRNLGTGIGRVTGGANILIYLVNIIIISIVLYFIMNLVGKKYFKADSNTSKVIFFIVLIFLAGVIAFRVGNQWIWAENAFVRPAFRYLFSGEEPLGILRPTRILIFIGASFLLYWLFISTVKIGQGKNKIDLAIAILLAADMTHEGLTSNWLITFGQVISIWLLYRQFKKEGDANWSWAAAVWSTGLVIWISAIAFPGKGFFAVRLMGDWFKTIGLYGSIIFIVIAGVVLTAVGMFRNKKEDEAKEEKESRWRKVLPNYILDPILKWMGRTDNETINRLNQLIDPRRSTSEDEATHHVFRDLRVEFMTMMNYILRVHVYKAKKGSVDDTNKFVKEDIYWETGLNSVFDIEKIKSELDVLKNGVKIENNGNKIDYEVINNRIKHVEFEGTMVGFNCTESLVFQLINTLLDELDELPHLSDKNPAKAIDTKLMEELGKAMDQLVGEYGRQGSTDAKNPGGYFKRRCAYNVLESKRIHNLDQKRKTGKYDHTYKFAREDAPFEVWKVKVVEDEDDTRFGEIQWETATPARHESSRYLRKRVPKSDTYEVDYNGFSLDKINDLIINKKLGVNLIYRVIPKTEVKNDPYIPYKVKRNILDHTMFNEVLAGLGTEWEMYIKDVRYGEFHPNSRSAIDYTEVHDSSRSYNYKGVVKGIREGGEGHPAFDREALKNPNFVYFGRKKWVDDREELRQLVKEKNDLPCISTTGMRDYITSYLRKQVPKEQLEKHLPRYTFDTGGNQKIFTDRPQANSEQNAS